MSQSQNFSEALEATQFTEALSHVQSIVTDLYKDNMASMERIFNELLRRKVAHSELHESILSAYEQELREVAELQEIRRVMVQKFEALRSQAMLSNVFSQEE